MPVGGWHDVRQGRTASKYGLIERKGSGARGARGNPTVGTDEGEE